MEEKTVTPNTTNQNQPGNQPGSASRQARERRNRNLTQRKRSFRPNKRGRGGRQAEETEFETRVIQVRRVTRVVKGGKRMRFSALVVVGDHNGKVGIGLMKGLDYQDAVNKATKKAKQNIIRVSLNEDESVVYPSQTKFKACQIYLKPANKGTGVIAGGFLRPLLELAGVKNVYSKIIRSRNKVAGTQAGFEALKRYQIITTNTD